MSVAQSKQMTNLYTSMTYFRFLLDVEAQGSGLKSFQAAAAGFS
jgi:hypothetical protein